MQQKKWLPGIRAGCVKGQQIYLKFNALAIKGMIKLR